MVNRLIRAVVLDNAHPRIRGVPKTRIATCFRASRIVLYILLMRRGAT